MTSASYDVRIVYALIAVLLLFPHITWNTLTLVFSSQLIINTAIVYMHRFYMIHSFTKFHRNVSNLNCNIHFFHFLTRYLASSYISLCCLANSYSHCAWCDNDLQHKQIWDKANFYLQGRSDGFSCRLGQYTRLFGNSHLSALYNV